MKKELFVVASLIALLIVGSFLFVPKNYLTGNVISSINFPTDCSETNIKELWDSVFVENSAGIVYNTNTDSESGLCKMILATKNNSQTGFVLYFFTNREVTYLLAKKTLFNSTSKGYTNLTNELNYSSLFAMISIAAPPEDVENRSIKITSISLANSTFLEAFKLPFTTYSDFEWAIKESEGVTPSYLAGTFSKTDNYSIGFSNFSRIITGTVYSNFTDQAFVYSLFNETTSSCTPNWTRQESLCYANDTKVVFYNDSNNCNILTGKPASSVLNCDNNSNGVIGEIAASQNSLNLSVYVAGSLFNSSFNYSNSSSNRLVEIKNNGKTVLSFMYRFTDPLVLNNISIKLNSNSSAFGYILVNGLNEAKSVILDKKNSSSTQVCVKDEYVSSVSDFSDFCEDDKEYLVSCPGTNEGYTCNISGNYFNVSGLEHSAVKEMILTQNITICIQNWSCTAWSNCTNLIRTRSCNDTARCNNLTGRPNLTESCVPAGVVTPTCVPQWSCTAWSPEKCSGENQTRSCTDLNKCNSNTNKPAETQKCSSSLRIYFLWATIILFILLIGTVIYFLISKYSGKNEVSSVSAQKKDIPPIFPPNSYSQNKTSVPSVVPSNVPPEIPDVK